MKILASDARSWLHCHRKIWFQKNPPPGYEKIEINEFDQILITAGTRHEWEIKRTLAGQYQVVQAISVEHTRELMKAGVQIIYQGQLFMDGIFGKPDFMIRRESGEYQPADAKLAHNEDKKDIIIQLGVYRKLLNTSLPALAYLGDGTTAEIGQENDREVDKFISSMREIVAGKTPPHVRYSESKCGGCPYNEICKPEFEAKGELTLLYGIDSRMAPGLEAQGISNITKLAKSNPKKISDVPYLKGDKKERAVLQAKAYLDGSIHQLKPIKIPDGNWIHFDVESLPLTESGNEHVYLWGFLKPKYDGYGFQYVWTDSEKQDKEGWLGFLTKIEEYRETFPDLVLAHFSHYEIQKIKIYAKRYDMQEHQIVKWLLGYNSPMFDLLNVIRDCFVLPVSSYGLKSVCKHPKIVNFQWDDDDSGAQWSIVQFLNYLAAVRPDDKERLKRNILIYNYNDVVATRKLEEWLRARI